MSRKPSNTPHWGEWLIQRSRVVGFRLQDDLARAVGCRAEQISRWAQLTVPPKATRKSFDYRLAAALLVSRDVLFNEWSKTSPDVLPSTQVTHNFNEADALRRKVQAIAELLGPTELAAFHDKGRELLAAGAAA